MRQDRRLFLPHRIVNLVRLIVLMPAILAGLVAGIAEAEQLDRIRPEFVIDREEIQRTGIANVYELLVGRGGSNMHGIGRPGVLGNLFTVFLVNGRPVPTAVLSYTLESLPVSAIERIEIYGSSRVASIGEGAIGGAVNIILRRDLEGTEFRAGALRPQAAGGDTDHTSLTWGGAVGEGHMVIGLDVLRHDEIRDADREFSRAIYDPDAANDYSKTTGVSLLGNTAFYVGGQPHPAPASRLAQTLGDCEGEGYVRIRDPAGYSGEGCGFAYADLSWHTKRFERNAVHLNLNHPLGDNSDVYVEARHAWSKSREVFAPSPGLLQLTYSGVQDENTDGFWRLHQKLGDNRWGLIRVGHRFVGHGNRVWNWELKETDLTLGVRIQLDSGLELDTYIRDYRYNAEEVGNAFINREKIHELIDSRAYDLHNPSASAQAIADSTVVENRTGSTKRRSAGLELSGAGGWLSNRVAKWRLGAEVEHRTLVNLFEYRGGVDQAGTIGSYTGNAVDGTRYRRTGYAEVEIPVTERWDVLLASRLSDFNDVGTAGQREIASRLRVNDNLTLRGSLSDGERAPSIYAVSAHEVEDQSHADLPNGRVIEVDYRTRGNPNIAPYDTRALNLGFAAGIGSVEFSVDWFRIDQSGSPVVPTVQSIITQWASGGELPDDIVVNGGPNSGPNSQESGTRLERLELVVPWVNLEDRTRSGVDARLATGWKTGSVDWSVDTRWLYVNKARSSVFGKEEDDPLTPRSRIHNLVRAGKDNLSADWSFNYVSGYRSGEVDDSYPSWKGHDISLNWKKAFGNEGVEFTAGVLNVTDEGPPILPTSSRYYISSLDSSLGRSLFVTTSITW